MGIIWVFQYLYSFSTSVFSILPPHEHNQRTLISQSALIVYVIHFSTMWALLRCVIFCVLTFISKWVLSGYSGSTLICSHGFHVAEPVTYRSKSLLDIMEWTLHISLGAAASGISWGLHEPCKTPAPVLSNMMYHTVWCNWWVSGCVGVSALAGRLVALGHSMAGAADYHLQCKLALITRVDM